MKILYVTDMHGNPDVYEFVLTAAARKGIDALVLGGDLAPAGPLSMFIPTQRAFLEKYLLPLLREFREGAGKPVFGMMGNDDFRVNLGLLEKAEKEGLLSLLHLKTHRLGRYTIAGYSCVNPIPFFLKDWEREESRITEELKAIAPGRPGDAILVFHAPPRGTKLDMLYNGEHVGSAAVRAFLEEHQPLLSLHGHIHESPEMSGSMADRIGRTVCVNPGDGNPVVIDLSRPDKIQAIGPET
jgi:Icc-related predicted phosphoesterase